MAYDIMLTYKQCMQTVTITVMVSVWGSLSTQTVILSIYSTLRRVWWKLTLLHFGFSSCMSTCTYTVAVAYANCPREGYIWWACLWILWYSTISLFVMSARNSYTLSCSHRCAEGTKSSMSSKSIALTTKMDASGWENWATIPLEFWCVGTLKWGAPTCVVKRWNEMICMSILTAITSYTNTSASIMGSHMDTKTVVL